MVPFNSWSSGVSLVSGSASSFLRFCNRIAFEYRIILNVSLYLISFHTYIINGCHARSYSNVFLPKAASASLLLWLRKHLVLSWMHVTSTSCLFFSFLDPVWLVWCASCLTPFSVLILGTISATWKKYLVLAQIKIKQVNKGFAFSPDLVGIIFVFFHSLLCFCWLAL